MPSPELVLPFFVAFSVWFPFAEFGNGYQKTMSDNGMFRMILSLLLVIVLGTFEPAFSASLAAGSCFGAMSRFALFS